MTDLRTKFLEWRGIVPGRECTGCEGSGVKTYPSTATWRGGMGGSAMTKDVCNECWGSGDHHKPWPNRRATETARPL